MGHIVRSAALWLGRCAILAGMGSPAIAASAPAPAPVTPATPRVQAASAPAMANAASIAIEMMPPAVPAPITVRSDDGYNGQWYSPAHGPLASLRLGGGLALYPIESEPVAVYASAADKTFFVYAGTPNVAQHSDKDPLRVMISYFDHKTGTVPRPVILLEGAPGAYGCPALALDSMGRIYVFAGFLGTDVPGQILRSTQPYDITAWEKVMDMDFRNPQAWSVPGQGFMLLHTRTVDQQARVCFSTSPDGLAWSKPVQLAKIGIGDSCISGLFRNKVGVALNYQPEALPATDRTNLYYLETSDLGKTWQTFPRQAVQLPLTEVEGAGLVSHCAYGTQYRTLLRGISFSQMGNPMLLYITRPQHRTLPSENSRMWTLSRWAGRAWETLVTVYSDSDFDGGTLATERLAWFMAVPTIPGPQPNSAGGDLVRWRSEDGGRSWYPLRLSRDAALNQNWPRHPFDGNPGLDFLWADGNARSPSASRIYFADRRGNVYVLPTAMKDATAKPELLIKAPPPATKPAIKGAMSRPTPTAPSLGK